MLHSAFLAKLYRGASKINRKHLKNDNKVWSYVGRFMTGFALVEYQVNQLCHELLSGDYVGSVFVIYSLDLRKRLELVEALLAAHNQEHDYVEEWKTLKSRINKIHDVRNIVAHWPWSDAGSGMWCDYLDKKGHTDFEIPKAKTRDRVIEYSQLDSYDIEASDLYERLERLTHAVMPITDYSDDLRRKIEETISSSGNIIRFPSND
jgi:hypothetical protein